MLKPFLDKKNLIKILFSLFIIVSIILVAVASLGRAGLKYDGMWWFAHILDELSYGHFFIETEWQWRSRGFINVVNQLPVNIAYHVFHIKSKYWLGVIFTVPLFLFPFIVTLYQCHLAKRTKRYDIAVLALLLYGLFIMPTLTWSIVEIILAAAIFFLLFHYFVSDIDYKWYDLIVIFLCVLISYNSTEAIIIAGLVLFFSSFFYLRRIKTAGLKNCITKYFIAVNSFIMPFVYIAFYKNAEDVNFWYETKRCIETYLITYMIHCKYSPFILVLVLSVSIIIYIYFKNKISKKMIYLILFSYFLCILLSVVQNYQHIFLILSCYLFRILMYGALVIVMLLPVLFDISGNIRKIKNKIRYYFIIALCAVVTTTCFQILISYLFYINTNYMVEDVKKSKSVIYIPSKLNLGNKAYNLGSMNRFYHWCDSLPYAMIVYSDGYEIEKLVSCTVDMNRNETRFYDSAIDGTDKICLCYTCLTVKNEFWDLSAVYEYMRNNRKFKENFYNMPD